METPSNNQDSSSDQQNKAFKNLEEEISYHINQLRFRSRQFMQNVSSHILTNNDTKAFSVNFADLQRTVYYNDPIILRNFIAFLQENMITNQILQDFTFPPKLNEVFANNYGKIIAQNKSLGLFEGNQKIKSEIPSKFYYGYYLQQISIQSMQSLLGFIIFEEYVTLTTKMNKDTQNSDLMKPNFCIEYNDKQPIEYIPFLSNFYNTLLINVEKIQNNDPTLYNIYILLLSESIDENEKKEIKNRISNLDNLKEKKQRNSIHNSSLGNMSLKIPLIPEKYKDLWSTHMQIPAKSIERLVQMMDSNNDMKITVRDIRAFSHKQHIHLNEEVYEGMFLEAVKNRPVIFPKQKETETINTMPPLTVPEIQKALWIHLKKDGNQQKEIYKPYYDVWLMFLNEIGEHNLIRPNLKHEPIQPILDQKDEFFITKGSFKSRASNTLKSCENLTNTCMTIRPLKNKCYVAPYRAEANLIINNTENIQEVVVERDDEIKPKNSDEFAKTINGQFIESASRRVNEFKSITFYTQKYYQEALRLSKKPDLYQKTEKNPIITYIPENFDFKINKEKEKPFINKKSSILSSLSPPTISYISDKKNMDSENNDEEIDNVSTINNINQIGTGVRSPIAEKKRAKTSLNFISRRKISSLHPKSRESSNYTDRNGRKLFLADFKPEDCKTLKKKLAKLEPVVDKYAPPSSHMFRDEVPNEKNVLFKTRFKCDPLDNPYNMSQHDLRPKEALDKEEKGKNLKEREEEENLSKFLGKFIGKGEWSKYFRRADLHRKEGFIDHKHPEFIAKGHYVEPTQIMNNLLRGEAVYDKTFKLFHRSLRNTDKNLYFGQNKGSEF